MVRKLANFIFNGVLILFFQTSGQASDNFSKDYLIRPYIVRNPAGDLTLKVKTKKPKDLLVTLKTRIDGTAVDEQTIRLWSLRKDITDIFLPYQTCNIDFTFQVAENGREEIGSGQQRILPYPCDVTQDLVFGLIGDTQSSQKRHHKVAKIIRQLATKQPISFILNAGDIVQSGGAHRDWHKFFKGGRLYNKNIPLIAAMGNHDYIDDETGENFKAHFHPVQRPQKTYQYFSYPHMDLIVLNSNFEKTSNRTQKTQIKWLKVKLNEAKIKDKTVVVAFHHSPFSSGAASKFFEGKAIKDKIVPLLEASGQVKLVLSGHIHMYERSFKSGIHYVVTGPAGGRSNIWFKTNNPYKRFLDKKANTVSVFKVNVERIHMETYNETGQVIDSVKIPIF